MVSNKIKIAIDITYTPSGGSLTQILNMIKYFNLNSNIDIVIYSKRKNTKLLLDVLQDNNSLVYSILANLSVLTRIIWGQLLLPFYLQKDKIDVLFCPGNIAPILTTVKSVVWIGTIGPFFSEFYKVFNFAAQLELYFNKYFMIGSAYFSDAVVFESEFTKKVFVTNYKIKASKSYVIHIGNDTFFHGVPNPPKEFIDNYSKYSPYALCVSHLYPYKNIIRMIEAFANSNKKNAGNIKLYIAGSIISKKYYASILEVIKAKELNGNVVFLGSVSKENLHYLYSNCEFMIFPSPYENFAYTLVEAMICGAPIVCSNTTAMPETCGNAALYFDPYNTEEMSDQISQFLNNEKLRNTYRKKSLARAKELPDYEEVTLQTLNIMKDLVNE